ncbi:MAG: sialidase family protein [Actinomycetota bacterium]
MRSIKVGRFLAVSGLVAALAAAAFGSAASRGAALRGQLAAPSKAPVSGGSLFAGSAAAAGSNVNITNKAGAQSETTVAVDPLDANHLISSSNDLTDTMHVYESLDGGATWQDANLDLLPAFCYDPWVDFGLTPDTVNPGQYLSYPIVSYECSDERIAWRKPGTTTWKTLKFSVALAGTAPDRDMVVADNNPASPFFGSVYVGFDDNGNANTAYVLSTRNLIPAAGNPIWKRSPKINDVSTTIGVNVAVRPDGTITASWLDYSNQIIYSDRSTDGGLTWGADHVITTLRIPTQPFFINMPPQPTRGVLAFPFTVAAPAGAQFAGRVYASYFDIPETGSTSGLVTNIYVRHSDDGGVTWSAPKRLSDNGVPAPTWNFFPAISVAPDGAVGVSFYDTRDDATGLTTNRYFSLSTDGGDTWSPNFRISSAPSAEYNPLSADANQYGDYEGMDAGPTGSFYSVWADSRSGSQAEDMFGAPINR